jgi:hypothetical protein
MTLAIGGNQWVNHRIRHALSAKNQLGIPVVSARNVGIASVKSAVRNLWQHWQVENCAMFV